MGSCCSNELAAAKKAEQLKNADHQLSTKRQAQCLRNNFVNQSSVGGLSNLEDKYEVVKQLGVGSMGSVASVRKKTNFNNSTTSSSSSDTLYAMKTLRLGRLTPEFQRELENEIRIVSDLDHAGIVKFHHIFRSAMGRGKVYIIMDLCSGGDLYKREPYTEGQAANILRQLLSAVAYMHSRGYVHRDLKFENIMFESPQSDQIKIIDFGLSARFQKGSPLRAQVGTFHTMSPETFQGNYGSPADVWSVGVIAYELNCGQKPWTASNAIALMQQVCLVQYSFDDYKRFPRWRTASNGSKDFCRFLLQREPDKRPTALQALQHSWVAKTKEEPIFASPSTSTFRKARSNDFRTRGVPKLMAYTKLPQLQKIATLLVAHDAQAVPHQIEELRALFQEYDKDGTGVISLQEFKAVFLNSEAGHVSDKNNTKTVWKELFDGMDTYRDGKVSYTEFLAAALTVFGFVTEERIVASFEHLDTDGSGAITVENLRVVLGRDFDKEAAAKMLAELDITHDGKVSLEEFLAAFRKTTLASEDEEEIVELGSPVVLEVETIHVRG